MTAFDRKLKNRVARLQGQLRALEKRLGTKDKRQLFPIALAVQGAGNSLVLTILRHFDRDI